MNTHIRNSSRLLWAALRALIVLTVVLGVVYPLAVTGIAQGAFHHTANGSTVQVDGRDVGSSQIGQSWNTGGGKEPDPRWFQGRPSAADHDALASGASNLAVTSPELLHQVEERKAQVAHFNHIRPAQVPADAVTASGSGLDPDISPAYARLQVDRVADARGLSADAVRKLVADHTEGRQAGFLGDPTVNVLQLNVALHRMDG